MAAGTPQPKGPSPAWTLVLISIICLTWGSTWLVIKVGLQDLPPLTAAGLRFLVAGSAMAVLARFLGRFEGGARPERRLVLAHGLCQFVANYALVYWGETVLPSGIVSVLWSVFPILMGFSGHYFLRQERLRASQWLGLLIAFAGMVLLFTTDIPKISGRAVGAGLLVLLAPLSVTISTTLIKRRGAAASSLLLNRDAMLLGGVVLSILGLYLERDQSLTFSARALGSIAYLALAGTVLTFGIYMWLLRYVAAHLLSLISYVTPVLALLLGAWLGGEALGRGTILGTGLVLGGVAATGLRRRAATI